MLSRRDEEILRIVHFYRYMTVIDVAYRLFTPGGKTHVRDILSRLCGGKDKLDNQYLYRFGLPTAQKGNFERAVILGNRGRDFLINNTGLPVNWYFRPGRWANLNYSQLTHSLAVTRFLVVAHWWCKQQKEYQLVDVKISYGLVGMPGKTNDTAIPDGWLLFERKDGKRGAVILEIDRGTEYQERFKAHVASRMEFLRSGADEKMFGVGTMFVVYVSVGESPYKETRRRAMAQWTKEALKELGRENWAPVFRFAAVELSEVYTAGLFDGAVWYSPDESIPSRLFGS